MTEQKIHPAVDVEAPRPTPSPPPQAMPPLKDTLAPAMPPVKTTLAPAVPPVKATLPLARPANIPPIVPVIPPAKKKNRTCLCRVICWTISLLVLLLVILGATIGILFLVFQPKVPKYSINSLKISSLNLNYDMSLYAQFDVKVTANNPNKKIGIYYEKGSHLSVWYTNTKLCQGPLPRFYQGHQNITKLDVTLTGHSQYGTTLLKALQEQQQTGRIPLDLKIDAPVAIKLGKMKLKKVRVLGHCLLVVDSLTTNNLISIKASDCSFRLKL